MKEDKSIKLKSIFLSVVMVLVFSLVFTNLFAEERKYELNTTSVIKDILKEHIGKMVTVRLDSGEALEGLVVKVGDHLVHISRLSGKDFYDAVARIDRISTVIFKVRGN
jgi:hypothetical protein